MSIPLWLPAPQWTAPRDRKIILYHGCTAVDQTKIEKGIDLRRSRVDSDFGRGFYMTTGMFQAQQWAWTRFYQPEVKSSSPNHPVVLEFHVDRHLLAKLSNISFVIGDPNQDDYWSLVQHCRNSQPNSICDHQGPVTELDGTQWYDVAFGPVAALWRQRFTMQNADQVSFHTKKAIRLLDQVIRRKRAGEYRSHTLES